MSVDGAASKSASVEAEPCGHVSAGLPVLAAVRAGVCRRSPPRRLSAANGIIRPRMFGRPASRAAPAMPRAVRHISCPCLCGTRHRPDLASTAPSVWKIIPAARPSLADAAILPKALTSAALLPCRGHLEWHANGTGHGTARCGVLPPPRTIRSQASRRPPPRSLARRGTRHPFATWPSRHRAGRRSLMARRD